MISLVALQSTSVDMCHVQGYLTKEQEAALREMREGFPQSTAFHTDHDILRFLRAREFNMKATRAMYQHYLSMVRSLFTPQSISIPADLCGPQLPTKAPRGMLRTPGRWIVTAIMPARLDVLDIASSAGPRVQTLPMT